MPEQQEVDMNQAGRPEARRIPRVPLPPGTVVETNGHEGFLLDFSPLGARVETPASIHPNETMNLAWRRNGRLVKTTGVVVWSEANLHDGQLSYQAGIQFLEQVSLRDTGFLDEDFGLPS